MRKCLSLSLALFLCMVLTAGCKNITEQSKNTQPSYSDAETRRQTKGGKPIDLHRLSPINRQITEQIIPDLIDKGEVVKIRRRGILRIRLLCDREPLCFKDPYGIPAGFEVELLGKFAQILNVKLNIVELADEPCDLQGPIIEGDTDLNNKQVSDPYFYRRAGGWHRMRITSEDPALKEALNRIVRHFYETGTYQQIYKNWFKEG
ncbi:MAG: hypothetical protein AB1546_09000 [bacterium]